MIQIFSFILFCSFELPIVILLSSSCTSGKKYKNNKITVLRIVVVVHLLSCIQLFVTLWTGALQTPLPFTISWILLKLMSTELLMPSNYLIPCLPLLLLPSFFPSIRAFPTELALRIRWLVYWNFSFSISPSSEYSGLICSKIDWFDLLAVQGTLKSLFQHHNSKAFRTISYKTLPDVLSQVRISYCGPPSILPVAAS